MSNNIFSLSLLHYDYTYVAHFSIARIGSVIQYHIAAFLLPLDLLPYLLLMCLMCEFGKVLYNNLRMKVLTKTDDLIEVGNGMLTFFLGTSISLFMTHMIPFVTYVWIMIISSIYIGSMITFSRTNKMLLSTCAM